MHVEWDFHSAEEIIAAIENVPFVLGPWERSEHSSLFMRHGKVWAPSKGTRAASAQSNVGCAGWHYALGYSEGDVKFGFASAETAMREADNEMLRRGWKLVGDVPEVCKVCHGIGFIDDGIMPSRCVCNPVRKVSKT